MPDSLPSPAPAAALFDMDGVLVDSNPFHYQAWNELSRLHHRQHTPAQLRYGLSGRKSEDILRYLFGDSTPEPELSSLAQEKELLFRRVIQGRVQPVAALPGFLQQLSAAGWRCAVATSAPRPNLDLILKELRLEQFFQAQVTAEEVRVGKPHPQVYQLAAHRLGMPADRCVVFEDAVAGIQSGRRAGMLTVGLATTCSPAELLQAQADLVVADFSTLTPALLLEHLHRRLDPV